MLQGSTKSTAPLMNATSLYIKPYTDPINFLNANRVRRFSSTSFDDLSKRLNSKSSRQLRLEQTD